MICIDDTLLCSVCVCYYCNEQRERIQKSYFFCHADRDTKKHHLIQNRKKKRESFVEERTDTLPFLVGRLNSTARLYTVSLSLFHSRVVVVVVVVVVC